MEQGVAGQRCECAEQDVLTLLADQLQQWCGLQVARLQQLREFRRDDEAQPCEQCDDVDRERDIERIAPAPIVEVGFLEAGVEKCEQCGRQHEAERRTEQIGRAHVELQSLMRISYAVFCLKKKTNKTK